MKEYYEFLEKQSKGIKAVLCIGPLDLLWVIYRCAKAYERKDETSLIVWILLAVFAGSLLWIFDLICVAINGEIYNKPFGSSKVVDEQKPDENSEEKK